MQGLSPNSGTRSIFKPWRVKVTSYGITKRLSLSADYIRGEFDGAEPTVDIAGASLTFEL